MHDGESLPSSSYSHQTNRESSGNLLLNHPTSLLTIMNGDMD
jgi:hypothetical protein